MAALLFGAAWQQLPLSVRGQRGGMGLCSRERTGSLGRCVLRGDAAAQGPSVGSVDRPQPWPLAHTPCLALGSVLARVALLHPRKIMGSTHPSSCNRLTHEERFKELNLSGLASHSCEGRGDERTVCAAWRVQAPGREQGHFARLGVMPRKGKTGWITGKKLPGVEELPSQGNLQTSSSPRGPDPRNATLMLGVPPSLPSLGLLSGTLVYLHDRKQPTPWVSAYWAGTGLHPIAQAQLCRITPAVNTAPKNITLHLLSPCARAGTWLAWQLRPA